MWSYIISVSRSRAFSNGFIPPHRKAWRLAAVMLLHARHAIYTVHVPRMNNRRYAQPDNLLHVLVHPVWSTHTNTCTQSWSLDRHLYVKNKKLKISMCTYLLINAKANLLHTTTKLVQRVWLVVKNVWTSKCFSPLYPPATEMLRMWLVVMNTWISILSFLDYRRWVPGTVCMPGCACVCMRVCMTSWKGVENAPIPNMLKTPSTTAKLNAYSLILRYWARCRM